MMWLCSLVLVLRFVFLAVLLLLRGGGVPAFLYDVCQANGFANNGTLVVAQSVSSTAAAPLLRFAASISALRASG